MYGFCGVFFSWCLHFCRYGKREAYAYMVGRMLGHYAATYRVLKEVCVAICMVSLVGGGGRPLG